MPPHRGQTNIAMTWGFLARWTRQRRAIGTKYENAILGPQAPEATEHAKLIYADTSILENVIKAGTWAPNKEEDSKWDDLLESEDEAGEIHPFGCFHARLTEGGGENTRRRKHVFDSFCATSA